MGKRNAQRSLLVGASAAAGLLMLGACNDNLTGQDGEPHGALKVTKLTLNDNGNSRSLAGIGVVTDTSVPADCSADAVKDLPKCNADPFGDKYGVLKSPPNPDSASNLRVVFNKAPMNLGGVGLEPVPAEGLPNASMPLKLADPTVIQLTCQNCSTDGTNFGVPATYNSLQLTGTDLSPDPSQYAYGPGLQMEVITTCAKPTTLPAYPTKCQLAGPNYMSDPARALEPGATYSVILNPMLQGRLADGTDNVLLDDSAKALLTFTTEPFKPLGIGIGQGTALGPDMKTPIPGVENDVTQSTLFGDGSATTPYLVGAPSDDMMSVTPTLDNAGAIVLQLNAPADEMAFMTQTISATVSVNGGAAMPVPVTISTALGKMKACTYDTRRQLYIAPTPSGATWLPTAMAGGVVTITIRGSDVRDLSQLPGHPAGKGVHLLSRDITIKAAILPASDPTTYGGVLAKDVVPPLSC